MIPDVIRRDIEQTRDELSTDVNALTDKVSPGRIVSRRTERVKTGLRGMKDKVMGSSDAPGRTTGSTMSMISDRTSDAAGTVGSTASSAARTVGDTVSSAASTVSDAATSAPAKVREQAQGNPLAAGLIVFGLGWLVSSLLPPSRAEQQVAGQLKEKLSEHTDTIKQEAGQLAREMQDNLREPAQQAVDSVRSTAGDAADEVRDEGKSAVQDVRGQARQAQEEVQKH